MFMARRILIINHMLMSLVWYFIAIWVGSGIILSHVQAFVWNHLWSRIKHTTRSRVIWDNCIIQKKVGGHNLEDVVISTMNKWDIQALFQVSIIFNLFSNTTYPNSNLPLMANGLLPLFGLSHLKRKEKITPIARYWRECQPISLMSIDDVCDASQVLCLLRGGLEFFLFS